MKKKVLAMVLTAVCAMGLMAGCGNSGNAATGTQNAATESGYKVGISQFAEHGSLDNCREGFLEGLKEEGIEEGKNLTVDYQNAQTDTGTASTIADSFVSAKDDLICAIATPCAASAYNSTMNTDIPVVYTAVSDPVSAGLANEDGSSIGNITGSSDILPVEEQLKMIRAMLPDAKKIGILYTTSEANSCSTIEEYKKLAGNYNFEIVDTGINTSADIEIAATDLVGKVDCLCNLTDNTVVNALQTVLDKANSAKIPVFGSEIEQVKSGCVASMGIDYYQLGIETGKMAAKILKGEEKASDTPYITASKAELYVNTAAADKIGMKLDESYIKDAAQTFDEIYSRVSYKVIKGYDMTLVLSVLEQGMIYAIMALGIYITYTILDFPDLTVDGSFPLGAALSAVLISKGMNPVLTLVIAFAAGAVAGTLTGLIHVKLKVRDLLSGIIMMTALYTVNLRIAGRANLPIYNMTTLFDNALVKKVFSGALAPFANTIIILIITLIMKFLLDWYMNTKSGYLLRAVGDNEMIVTSMGVDKGVIKIIGLAIANGLVTLSGCIFAQQQRYFDISMGTGTMVIGLASVIIGISLLKR